LFKDVAYLDFLGLLDIPGKSEPLKIEIHFLSSTIFFMKGFILSLPEMYLVCVLFLKVEQNISRLKYLLTIMAKFDCKILYKDLPVLPQKADTETKQILRKTI
jgi:hypothetical protein